MDGAGTAGKSTGKKGGVRMACTCHIGLLFSPAQIILSTMFWVVEMVTSEISVFKFANTQVAQLCTASAASGNLINPQTPAMELHSIYRSRWPNWPKQSQDLWNLITSVWELIRDEEIESYCFVMQVLEKKWKGSKSLRLRNVLKREN